LDTILMTAKSPVRLTLIIIFFIICHNSYAQSTNIDSLKNIRIFVVDSVSMSPLENCTLIIQDKNNNQLFISTSLTSGAIDLKVNIAKAYKYKFMLVGYRTKERNLDFRSRESATIGLVELDNTLKEVTITGAIVTRDADKLSYKVNSKKFLKGTDATVVLRDVPLVNINAKGDVEVKHNSATVLVNGQPMNISQLRTIPADKISTIDVITNPSSSSSASSKDGLISIRLKESDVPSISGSLTFIGGTLRRFLFPGVSLNANSKKVYVSFNASLQSIEQQTFMETESKESNTGALKSIQKTSGKTGYIGKNISLSSFYNPTKSTQLSLGVSYSSTKISLNSSGIDNFFSPAITYYNTNNYSQPGSSLSVNTEYSTKFKDKSALAINYLYQHRTGEKESNFQTRTTENYNFGSKYFDNTHSDAKSVQATYSRAFFKDALKAEIGSLFSDRRSVTANTSLLASTANEGIIESIADYITLQQQNTAAFLTVRYQIKGYSLRIGTRYEHLNQHYKNSNSDFKAIYDNLFPNIAAQKKISGNLDIILNYQRKITRPDISILNPTLFQYSNLASYEGNQYVVPELINKYDLNLDLKTGKTFFELGFYTTYTKNPIIYLARSNNSLVNYRYENAKRLLVYGSDLSAKMTLNEKLSLNAGIFAEKYSFSNELGSTTKTSGNNLGGNLSLYYKMPKSFSTSVDFSYKTNPDYSYQTFQRAYPTINASLSKNFFNNKFLASIIYNDILNTSSKNRSYYDDTYLSQIKTMHARTSNVVIFLSYSFGKQFYSGKKQNSVETATEKSFKTM
jgi:iron complex outermembrane receptor protein